MALPNSKLTNATDLLRPSAGGLFAYICLIVLTLVVLNAPGLQQFLGPVNDLHLGTWLTTHLNGLLDHIFGAHSGTLVLALFWVVVGVLVALLVMIVTSTLGDFDEALRERRYILPRGTDPNSPLKNFLVRLLFRIAMAILLVMFVLAALHFISQHTPPRFVGASAAPDIDMIVKNLLFIVYELIGLHITIFLLRMVALRHRLFN